jgi:nitroimidazol reductase NimA-like FMN-containing flavoprotein (pyridoxamine 5'-phosphate oxidase superfamily)/ribosomal protein S18 acetylase RimI-like enzyme
MRKEIFRMSGEEALALLARSPVVHIATLDGDGAPILRTVHGVVVDGGLAFHGAPAGEKMAAIGRPAVVSAEETVAVIPSYFFDPTLACPATTYYRSVQVHGVLEQVDDRHAKARALQALMRKYQPEGGHAIIEADDPRYRKQVDGILIVRVGLATIDGKGKLGQNRKPEEMARVLAQLWGRGLPGDPAAIETLRRANPDTPTPEFLRGPAGARLCCALGPGDLDGAMALLVDQYWNVGLTPAALARAQPGSTAWVGAHDEHGRLVATARAVTDTGKFAYVGDVAVAPQWRGRGLGSAVVRLLLGHPQVRGARAVGLRTRDMQGFYARFGFGPPRPSASTEMQLIREPT